MEDCIMKLTMHDYKHPNQLKNDLKNPEEIKGVIEKLANFVDGILSLLRYLQEEYVKKDLLLNLKYLRIFMLKINRK